MMRNRSGCVLAVLIFLGGLALPRGAQAAPPAARTTGCNQAAPQAAAFVDLPGHPFEPVATRDGCWIFVSLLSGNPRSQSGVAVLRRGGGRVRLVRVAPVESGLTGMVLTHDGKLLIATDDNYVVFLDTGRLESGRGDPILGYLSDGNRAGSVYVNVSADDRFVFVSDEDIQAISVIDLEKARRNGFTQDSIVGKIPVGRAPIALTFSLDGRYLYTTSEVAPDSWGWPETCTPEVPVPSRPGLRRPQGAIIVVDAVKARTDPAHSVLERVPAGCSPVRLVLSPKGDVAYVTVRHNNELAAFDTAKLLSDPRHALIGKVPVGIAPVGVAVIDGGKKLVVTNSNRFAGGANDRQKLTVIDAGRISAGAGAVLGTIPAGGFPRELRVTADGRTLLVTNFKSSTLELVDLARLPLDASGHKEQH